MRRELRYYYANGNKQFVIIDVSKFLKELRTRTEQSHPNREFSSLIREALVVSVTGSEFLPEYFTLLN